MRKRGKKSEVMACAMPNLVAHALVRDECPYDPTRWTIPED